MKNLFLLFMIFLECSLYRLTEGTSLEEIGNEIFINEGYAVSAIDGSLIKSSDFMASDYITIKELQKFKIPVILSQANSVGIAFYDENQSFLSGIQFPYETNIKYVYLNYLSPPKTKYFRTTYSKIAPAFSIVYFDNTKPTSNYEIFQMASPNINRNRRQLQVALDFGDGILIGSTGTNKGDGDVYIMRSTDYGFTWKVMGNGKNKGILESLYYGDHNGQGTAFIGTGDYSRHVLVKITNYGKDWEKDYQVNLSNSDLKYFVSTSNGCENVIYCGHKTWRAFINSMKVPSNTVILETNDDGLSWDFAINLHKDLIMYPLYTSFRSMTVTSDGARWGVGMHPEKYIGLWKSEDGGLNWIRKSTFQAFQSMKEFDGVYYAGAFGNEYKTAHIYISKDKGENWKLVANYTLVDSDMTYNRFFLNINGAVIAGFGSGEGNSNIKHFHFLLSTDKGETWKDIGERPSDQFNLAYIADPIYQNGRFILSSANGLYTF